MPFRNIETHFSQAPQASVKRSSFKYNMPVKLTFNAGDLVPFMCEEVLPGDTFDLKLSKVVRLTTSLHPTMDNLYLDTYFFYVPNRFLWDNWTKFMGENDKAWAQTTTYVPPKLRIGGTDGVASGHDIIGFIEPQSVLNYLMCPSFTNSSKKEIDVSAFPLNGFIKVFNDWFRSENLCDEVPMYQGDGYVPYTYNAAYSLYIKNTFGFSSVGINTANSCLKVAKFADYFTRALPQPQKGADVLIPAGGEVLFDSDKWNTDWNPEVQNLPNFVDQYGHHVSGDLSSYSFLYNEGQEDEYSCPGVAVGNAANGPIAYDPQGTLKLDGLQITVNNLRLAMQTQKLLERDARGGTRYIELIKSHFNVVSPDLRLQRSEYLGGKRTLINMSEVIQTSASSSPQFLGNLAGRSLTTGIEDSFIKSFTEHGIILGVMCVRPDRTYSQGIEKKWTRFDRLDYYFPVLANIGEMPIKNKEIFLTGANEDVDPDDVFGYQEAWAEYRTQRGRNVGFMQPGITGSLASWTYADNYSSTPYLSSQWLYQGVNEIDNTLTVASSTAPQFTADLLVYGKVVRPMPVYSIPGLVDHN